MTNVTPLHPAHRLRSAQEALRRRAKPTPSPLSVEDMRAAPLLLAVPPGYQPQIDTTTHQVLTALLQDMEEHRDCWHDPMTNPDAWLSAGFIHETLQALLSQAGHTEG